MQPYMIVNKQGYFMLRNDVLSNIKFTEVQLNVP